MELNNRKLTLLIALACFLLAAIYLLVEAPPPLSLDFRQERASLSIEEAFTIVAKENDEARTLYTRSIVGQGKKAGLQFSEDWRHEDVEAGPLPALFLRATAEFLEKDPVPMGLYLGSDFPIRRENLFTGIQMEKFQELKKDGKPKFFYDESMERYTAIFPDYASAQACVSCHNEHKDSPKTDWKLNDMMGATTWTYPKDSLSMEEALNILRAFRTGAAFTYEAYLNKTQNFKENPIPPLGKIWPSAGIYALPSVENFKDSLNRIASEQTLISILKVAQN